MVFVRTFEGGIEPFLKALSRPAFQSAFWLTLQITAITVPGHHRPRASSPRWPSCAGGSRAGRCSTRLVDLPFALSPVVIGLSLFLVYGSQRLARRRSSRTSASGSSSRCRAWSWPRSSCACPFVIREVIPVLREIGTDQEEAAYTLGASQWRTFWRVTLPAIRWGVIYGVILTTARSLGEYGAVAIVSGKISGKTETLTVHVEERYLAFDLVGAYTAVDRAGRAWPSLVLIGMQVYQSGRLRRRRHRRGRRRAAGDHSGRLTTWPSRSST